MSTEAQPEQADASPRPQNAGEELTPEPSSEKVSSAGPGSNAEAGRGTNALEDEKDAAEPLPKRPRRDIQARSRGQRMFGLVTSTLKKVANENEKRMTGEAGKRRAEIEERLKQKLEKESSVIDDWAAQEQQNRADLAELNKITGAIAIGEADFRVRKAQKRRLASFLCAKVDISRSTIGGRAPTSYPRPDRDVPTSCLSTTDYATDLPFGLEPLREGALYPIYYLPAKLLPAQEDELDEQEDRVDRLIDDAETEWRAKRAKMEQDCKELRDRIRERRQKFARENEGAEAQPAAGRDSARQDEMDTDRDAGTEPRDDAKDSPSIESATATQTEPEADVVVKNEHAQSGETDPIPA
ncbi:hypothetical protein OC846_004763 [Tilletia horrida]|uniref:Pinin/SDK/MemA protein domain-containing protein n=1 Tax=Tilletia horrida TaxID=155126 RepID=A0AAN6GMK2_9BASI|nr:hypothetical protein OC846_004763 [Tilletia horrida]KAK0548392.1 hypothetical protein OC845_003602 [Tilletia horrida]KAK0569846.1 hypothetical protein OC861_000557 [Tilletia horrida]